MASQQGNRGLTSKLDSKHKLCQRDIVRCSNGTSSPLLRHTGLAVATIQLCGAGAPLFVVLEWLWWYAGRRLLVPGCYAVLWILLAYSSVGRNYSPTKHLSMNAIELDRRKQHSFGDRQRLTTAGSICRMRKWDIKWLHILTMSLEAVIVSLSRESLPDIVKYQSSIELLHCSWIRRKRSKTLCERGYNFKIILSLSNVE